jgi:twitching motility protein PilT
MNQISLSIKELLNTSVKNNASDLHISPGLPPLIRIDGDLQRLETASLKQEEITTLFYEIMTEAQRKEFESQLEIDFSLDIPGLARFRVNLFSQDRGLAGAFRTIPNYIYTPEELGMPKVVQDITNLPNGLVLITGPTGSGKSTTLATLIDLINSKQAGHIITIEDPIEFLHESKQSLINQREVHRNTLSFDNALRSALREDPDIILVGEMRDLETIRLALTAAETGHLVFATLHTISAAKSVNRIIDAFPPGEKAMVRTILSETLQAVVSQTLLKKIGGGRVAALEIMLCNSAIRNLIREEKVAQMYSTIQTSNNVGMQTLDQHLQDLVTRKIILPTTAREVAVNKEAFSHL